MIRSIRLKLKKKGIESDSPETMGLFYRYTPEDAVVIQAPIDKSKVHIVDFNQKTGKRWSFTVTDSVDIAVLIVLSKRGLLK